MLMLSPSWNFSQTARLNYTIKLSLLFRPGHLICISIIHTQTLATFLI